MKRRTKFDVQHRHKIVIALNFYLKENNTFYTY